MSDCQDLVARLRRDEHVLPGFIIDAMEALMKERDEARADAIIASREAKQLLVNFARAAFERSEAQGRLARVEALLQECRDELAKEAYPDEPEDMDRLARLDACLTR